MKNIDPLQRHDKMQKSYNSCRSMPVSHILDIFTAFERLTRHSMKEIVVFILNPREIISAQHHTLKIVAFTEVPCDVGCDGVCIPVYQSGIDAFYGMRKHNILTQIFGTLHHIFANGILRNTGCNKQEQYKENCKRDKKNRRFKYGFHFMQASPDHTSPLRPKPPTQDRGGVR